MTKLIGILSFTGDLAGNDLRAQAFEECYKKNIANLYLDKKISLNFTLWLPKSDDTGPGRYTSSGDSLPAYIDAILPGLNAAGIWADEKLIVAIHGAKLMNDKPEKTCIVSITTMDELPEVELAKDYKGGKDE